MEFQPDLRPELQNSSAVNVSSNNRPGGGKSIIRKSPTIEDVVKFVRAGGSGRHGLLMVWDQAPVCNWAASRMTIFDTSDGF
jgi:hypothetical protein